MPLRIHKPTNTNTALSTKGTRQPHDKNTSSGSMLITVSASVAKSMPMVTPICGTLPKKPRRSLGAYSTASSIAPPHSPPMPKPCTKRSSTIKIGAAMPMA